MTPVNGTFDFYFDAADRLEELGAEFVLAVKHPSGVIVLCNLQQARDAGIMLRAMDKTLRDRFNPNPDPGSGI